MIDVRRLSGTQIQGWVLINAYDEGADGIIYVGERDGQEAVVKILFPEALAKNGFADAIERLELQLSLKGSKRHPNLVQIFEGGKAAELDDIPYLVMEFISGKSLDKAIKSVPRSAIPSLLKQLADAARYLESIGLVHRDIKPANIVISDDFSQLTLLDLGIVLMTPSIDAIGRHSGKEFVATTRYSPPEFVWRKEESASDDAWRAITFYQIGATLHDLIMRKPLFDGWDQPRAKLYDAVRFHSPEINTPDCEEWLIQLARCCLVKNWRERIQLVSWESFNGPPDIDVDLSFQRQKIKLRQIRSSEIRLANEANSTKDPENSRLHELWDLHNKVFMEIRQFLMAVQIFPKFSGTYSRVNDKQYMLCFEFEADSQLMFSKQIVAKVILSVDNEYEMATELKVMVMFIEGEIVFDGKWTEMLTVESASALIQQSLIQVADKIVPPA